METQNVALSITELFKVVPYNIDVTSMCSVPICKQSCLIDHLLHSQLWSIAMHFGGQCTMKHLGEKDT